MIRRRTAEVGFKVKLGCHVFRATGITAYLEAGGIARTAMVVWPKRDRPPRFRAAYRIGSA